MTNDITKVWIGRLGLGMGFALLLFQIITHMLRTQFSFGCSLALHLPLMLYFGGVNKVIQTLMY